MKRLILSAGVLVAGAGLTSCGGAEPALGCRVQGVNWAARYELVKVVSDPSGTGRCGTLKGEYLGLQRYNENKPGSEKLAIRPFRLGGVDAGDKDPSRAPYALGKLPDDPTDGFCAATDVSVAEQRRNDVVFRYEFSNVKVVVTESAPGTQMGADLRYTEGDCTAEYKVRAMFPAAKCTSDSDCALPKAPINPDFATVCTEGIHNDASTIEAPLVKACVPAKDIPSLKDPGAGT